MKSKCEIVLFTASEKEYAEEIVKTIENEKGEFFDHILSRDQCTLVDSHYIKNLRDLGRDLNRTVILDNCIHSFVWDVGNGIPVIDYSGGHHDHEL